MSDGIPTGLEHAIPALRERWQPTRGGLVNLFKYEDQVFRYENGHLLLRGNNGSGKSRVLALQLPFLFDGEISPSRVEPDRDPAKRMEWNLLMDQHERRTGYTWIEFGRRDAESGEAHFLTLGCGLEARRGGGAPGRWFFITRARVGIDLQLMTPQRVPLGRKPLGEALEAFGEGRTFNKASEYRAAVDDALFKLGARFGPLIDLLIQLRQPQLMRDMKEDQLSDALSEALPPVPDALVNQVAESFQGLDSDRQRTAAQREMWETVATFHDGYRQYLSVAVRRLCRVVREGHSAFEHASRRRREIEEQLEENRTARARALAEAAAARSELDKREAEIGALRESPEMRDLEELDEARRRAEEQEDAARRDGADLDRANQHGRTAAEARERCASECAVQAGAADEAHRSLAASHPELLGGELFSWRGEDLGAERKRLSDAIKKRREAVQHLKKRNEELSDRKAAHTAARAERDRQAEGVASAEERVVTTARAQAGAVEAFGDAVLRWASGSHELQFEAARPWSEALAVWLETRDGEFEFATGVRAARDTRSNLIAAQRAELNSQRAQAEGRRAECSTELSALRDGRQPEPPPRHTRSGREGKRDGAPFWKWFEFRDEVPGSEHAGWEAALESAGLLDAWVFPDGTFESFGAELRDDDFLVASGEEIETASSLAAVLKPNANVPAGLAGLLGRIGNHRDTAPCWVDRDGHWANGPHRGHWHKERAEFLGHRAREAARLARIAELEAASQAIAAELKRIAQDAGALDKRASALEKEVAAAPDTRAAEESTARLEVEREHLSDTKAALFTAESNLSAAAADLQESTAKRDRDAADLDLAEHAEPGALANFSDRMEAFERACLEFWPQWQRCLDFGDLLSDAEKRELDAAAAEAEMRSRAAQSRGLADRARSRADTLLANVGATVDELLASLERAESGRSRADADLNAAERSARETELHGVRLEEKQIAANEQRESAVGSRDRAVERMGVFVSHGVLREINPEYEPDRESFSATSAVDLARRMEQELKAYADDDAQWAGLQSGIATRFNELCDALGRHGHVPQLSVIDEASVNVVRCDFQGRPRGTRELGEIFAAELGHHERIFEEREREIIENHLIGEAAMQLQQLIRSGERWVLEVNDELSGVTTSSGIQLKFDWRVSDDEDEQLKPVRQLFLKSTAALTPDERATVGRFLHERIRAERESDDTLLWREHLARALDYRSWHRFGILRRDGGAGQEWKKLTRRVFGTGSGGEKAQTLTIPQFAAAAAHYKSAHPHAPRLILLDEVFVGIDAPARSRLMGLLETFDLDYVMTSESEWGTHPTVSALAIYQLASRQGFNAVAVTRWIWNGSEKVRDDSEDAHG